MTVRLARLAKRFAANRGFEIRRLPPEDVRDRCSLLGSLRTARSVGFKPATVLDIGAARGEWALQAASQWPNARYLLIDPLKENEAALTRAVQELGAAEYQLAAVGRKMGTVPIHVHPDLDGSSLYEEREEIVNGTVRSVPMTTVDQSVRQRGLLGPFLLKADVQGAELAVIEGASETLARTELIILEVCLFDFFCGASPQFEDLVAAMGERGFVAWDVFGMGYRPIDWALAHTDVAFVRRNGLFRRIQQYATDAQRREQLSRLTPVNPAR
jgi:FkbM family methyltransferase